MPPGLMSRRKSRHLVWEMGTGTGDWGIGTGEWRMGNGEWGMGQPESASAGRESIKSIIPIARLEPL